MTTKFDPARPTSLIFEKGYDARLRLVGAMFTAPADATSEELDMRVPLSIARWHRHANWCVPAVGQEARWLEWRGSHPLFGPDSRIASKTECDSVGGEFHDVFDPWMVHAHVFSEDDLDSVWGDGHEASHKGCEQAAMCRVRTEPQILHRRD